MELMRKSKLRDKPVIAMDLALGGKGGGPFSSTTRIMRSDLKKKYAFKTIHYRSKHGSGISISRIRDLMFQMKKINPDIVHFTGLQLSGFHIAFACRLCGIKNTIVTVRGLSGDMLVFNPAKSFVMTYILEPLTLLFTKKNISVSDFVRFRTIVKLFSHKSGGTIYNFPPHLKESADDQNIRDKHKIKDEDIVVVTVGRINKEKGYHILAEAIKKHGDTSDIKYVIVGTGDYLAEMQDELAVQVRNGQVIFLNHREDVVQILSACDIFVLPTLHETLSVALLEASIAGLALVASNTGGVPEIVEDNYNGYLVSPGNPNELYEKINMLYSNSSLREEFARNARNKVYSKFSPDSIALKTDHVYQQLLQGE
jgi:L-malate glycosyltransferase